LRDCAHFDSGRRIVRFERVRNHCAKFLRLLDVLDRSLAVLIRSKPRPVRGNGFARRSSFSSTAENRRHYAGLDHDDLHTERRHLETQRIRDSFQRVLGSVIRAEQGKRPPRSMRKRSPPSPPFTHAGQNELAQAHRPKKHSPRTAVASAPKKLQSRPPRKSRRC